MSRSVTSNRGSVLAVILATLVWPSHLHAQHRFRVNSTVDAVDVLPGDSLCETAAGECTLRAAIQESNALEGCDIIRLPAGRYAFTLPDVREEGEGFPADEDHAESGDLDIRDHLTVVGAGADSSVVSAGGLLNRVFHVSPGGTPIDVELRDLAVTDGLSLPSAAGILNNGHLRLIRTVVARNRTSPEGGGIYNTGTLIVRNSEFSGNGALMGGRGGAVYNLGSVDLRLRG